MRVGSRWIGVPGVIAATALMGCGESRETSRSEAARPSSPTVVTTAQADHAQQAASRAPLPFRVPPGYVAERVAAGPLVMHPMFAAFDDRGRLFVAGSSGHGGNGVELARTLPDDIRCLEDTDGDGRFDRATVFADRLTFPQGVLCHDGAVYTASAPSLWKLEDSDGDGVADRRTELLTGFPFTGIADDLHGPCLGPDGRIYWGVGRFDYAIRRPGGPVIRRGKAPLVMRSTPSGDAVEVFSGAMGNPVEMTFMPSGEVFAGGTFLSPESQGQGLRDALIHCVEGGLFSVRDRDLSDEIHTGELLPPLAQLGVAAASGLARVRGGPFGDDDHPTLYAALFNLHDVPRFSLTRDGATFRAREERFLESDEPDFHPTDVLEDADGSLLVVDTGGWFIHCPTSQIEKPQVFGAIYRVRRKGTKPLADPRGLRLSWEGSSPSTLVRRLDDDRFAVRDRAVALLAKQDATVVDALVETLRKGKPRSRIEAVWALTRLNDIDVNVRAREAIREALGDPQESVRIAAAAAAGLHRDPLAREPLQELMRADTPPALRRQAAAALGRIGRAEAAPALLEALGTTNDRFLDHALIYALIRIDDTVAVRRRLNDPNPSVRRGALIALNEMDGGTLTPEEVIPMLDPTQPDLRGAAFAVITGHPEWAGSMTKTLRHWLMEDPGSINDPARRDGLRRQLLAFAGDPGVRSVITDGLRQSTTTSAAARAMLFEVLAAIPPTDWPPEWIDDLARAFGDHDASVAAQAIFAARAADSADLLQPVLSLARDTSRPDSLRASALEAAAPRLTSIERPLFDFLIARLDPDGDPLIRLSASRTLSRAVLDTDQLVTLTNAVAGAGALILPNLLTAFERSREPRVGAALVNALGKAPGLTALTHATIQKALRLYPHAVRRRAGRLYRRLDQSVSQRAARLNETLPLVKNGDAKRGREVFFGSRVACSTCHTVRGEGGHVGPDLTRIGAVRKPRDLLEAVLFPSASFARGYEPMVVATDNGRIYTGVVVSETGDAIRLVTADRTEVSLPRQSVEGIEPGRVSVMPQGLDANLSHTEFADLIAFLYSLH